MLFAPDDPRLFDFIETRRAIDYHAFAGMRVRSIDPVTLPIFNPQDAQENNALYRAINYLHISTRGSTVSRQLLVKPGDALDGDRIRESERILRGANYLYDAMILPARTCGNDIDLLLVVRDIWTLQPTANYSRTGGQSSTSLGISDDNILGYGHGLSLSYDRNADRSGVVFGYHAANLLDGHTRLALDHASNDDGRSGRLQFERPFYALDTRRAGGFETSETIQREQVVVNGVQTADYRHDLRHAEAYVGFSPGLRDNRADRFRLGFTRDVDRFGDQDPLYTDPVPEDRVLVYPWLEYERVENDFLTTLNVSQLFRNEDINVGEGWRVRFGVTSSALGSLTDALVGQASYDNAVSLGTHHLLRTRLSADAYWNENTREFENTLAGGEVNYDYFLDDNNRWHAMLALDAGINLSADTQLEAGGGTALRGYPAGWQRGDRRVMATVERRHFYEAHPFNLFRIGSAIFLDAGQAWDSTGMIPQSDRVLVDVGIGLRVNSSKAQPTHVMHIDLAVPLTDRQEIDSVQFSVQSQASF